MAVFNLAAFISSIVFLSSAVRCEDEPVGRPVVDTEYGAIMGTRMMSRGGREYAAFTSVPYAKPPVGLRRFKPPEPVDPWEGTLDASKELEYCLQVPIYDPFLRNTSRGTDDCLYLNVFSPNLTGSMAVMVYLHGGGWRSSAPGIGPPTRSKYLMDEDIVLVTPNYRLGALGFLSTEDKVISGNFGLKDQVAALKWVRANIKAFGGDPSKVTVFGESAGGASSHLLLLSPASRDLLSGGISQSGVAHALWVVSPPGVARYRARRLAESLSCPKEPHGDLLDCLLTKSSKEIVESDWKFNVGDYIPTMLYQPVIESRDVQEPFLTESPFNTVNRDKPWMTGINSGEGGFRVISLKVEPGLVEEFQSDFDGFLTENILYTNTTSQPKKVTEMLKKRYFSEKEFLDGLNEIMMDSYSLWPLVIAGNLTEAPMYSYLFDHRGKTSSTDIMAKAGGQDFGDLGVSHTDELLYLFDFEDLMPNIMHPEDVDVSKRLIKFWTNFAKHGVPTLPEDELKWDQYGEDKSYLKITTKEAIMEKNFKSDAVKFWLSLPVRDKMERLNI